MFVLIQGRLGIAPRSMESCATNTCQNKSMSFFLFFIAAMPSISANRTAADAPAHRPQRRPITPTLALCSLVWVRNRE
jgi:hypothetical protein